MLWNCLHIAYNKYHRPTYNDCSCCCNYKRPFVSVFAFLLYLQQSLGLQFLCVTKLTGTLPFIVHSSYVCCRTYNSWLLHDSTLPLCGSHVQFNNCSLYPVHAWWHSAYTLTVVCINKAVTDCRLRPRCCHLGSYFKRPKSRPVRLLAGMPLVLQRAPFVTKPKAAHALRSVRRDVEQPWLRPMCKCDVIYKTGNT